jgi:F-type H+-transporting ATPase subunit b
MMRLLAAEVDATRIVLPDPDELIFGAIAFIILFSVVAKFAFPALRKTLQAREDAIKGELESAEQARLESEKKREEYDRLIAEANTEADRIMREASEAADEARRDRIAKAEAEARLIVDRARQDAAQERDRAFAALRVQVADISIEAATRVLGKELSDTASQRQLVEQFISQTGNGNGGAE